MLSQLQLEEPIVLAMVDLLQTSLPAVIDTMNNSITDSYTVDVPVQYLPVMPYEPVFQGGLPLIGVGAAQGGTRFVDDLQFDMDAMHQFAVVAVVQNADYVTLAWQLRRLVECVAYTIQADRMLNETSVMKSQGGLWSVNFLRTEPGPILGDIDPMNQGAAPKAWISWTGLVFEGMRKEVNGV